MKPVLKMLVLDDSSDDALMLERMLSRHGIPCEMACVDTEEGMRSLLEQREWDLIISDYYLKIPMIRRAQTGAEGRVYLDINRALQTTITVCRNEWKNVANLETELGRGSVFTVRLPTKGSPPDGLENEKYEAETMGHER